MTFGFVDRRSIQLSYGRPRVILEPGDAATESGQALRDEEALGLEQGVVAGRTRARH